MAEISFTEAQQQFLELPDRLQDDPLIITKEGQPIMVALSYEQFSSLVETLEILSDPEFSQNLQKSIAQAKRGETISWEDAKVKLGL
ncbi:MAG TPA: prevent-host-death protein [Planktothrix sp. UBA8407]|jgi:prevent-host-death family protein|nr:prevent-host-death protein [Planktothrix sp. UBA8407]HBK21089.1 prevent-host-death protein [Planktothrix sp. UBA10369]